MFPLAPYFEGCQFQVFLKNGVKILSLAVPYKFTEQRKCNMILDIWQAWRYADVITKFFFYLQTET